MKRKHYLTVGIGIICTLFCIFPLANAQSSSTNYWEFIETRLTEDGEIYHVINDRDCPVPTVSLSELIQDHTSPHEIQPHGFYRDYIDYKKGFTISPHHDGNVLPSGYKYITFWGNAFESIKGSASKNTMVTVKEPHLYVFSIARNEWIKMEDPNAYFWNKFEEDRDVNGAMFFETFDKNKSFETGIVSTEEQRFDDLGKRSLSAVPGTIESGSGEPLAFHFWSHRSRAPLYGTKNDYYNFPGILNESDIGGVYVVFQGKLSKINPKLDEDYDMSSFVMNAGADYYKDAINPDGRYDFNNPGVGFGRLKKVTQEWKCFTFCTMPIEDLKEHLPPGVVNDCLEKE